jgi:hypothetical protein
MYLMNMARFYQILHEVVEIYFIDFISTKTAMNIYLDFLMIRL